ncbi:MAG TPA: bifunctional UDP-N-acetylglucosamine diphosphorylase/glucosamine-1-phosphate N-acetyltransferase GlmU [Thermodesulfobacteriota bacterium]|nr:bifunctional UDP-N-acetylglucosamine diphosphorylase/glucosamine-1-phosphate N-acetyltransferase GlmU [Thermodesulfobacteriota bacterium]
MSVAAVILAAGIGKRMKSSVPKVLHPVLGRPMLGYVIEAVRGIKPKKIVVVVGHGRDDVKTSFGADAVLFTEQKIQLGTGHAANCARDALSGFKGNILILNGDFPLITSKSLNQLIKRHESRRADVSFLTASVDDPSGYGRVLRNGKGEVERIIEDKDASRAEKKIKEINSGTYCVKSSFLWDALRKIGSGNKQKEYYLTDIIGIAEKRSLRILGIPASDPREALGINDRVQLSEVEAILKNRINESLMRGGVSMIDPDSTFISPGVRIGEDTVIYPHTHIYGKTVIGGGSSIGPGVWIEDSVLGSGVTVRLSSYITKATIGDNVTVGPFAHLRPEAEIMEGAKIGNFVEIKKSRIGQGSKVPHLSYVGDAVIGKDVNIGAGTITCNYDGFSKYETKIADDVFIGSDTMLVAPVSVGRGATTGAGSTITKDVPEGALAIGRARQTVIENWSRKPKDGKGKK